MGLLGEVVDILVDAVLVAGGAEQHHADSQDTEHAGCPGRIVQRTGSLPEAKRYSPRPGPHRPFQEVPEPWRLRDLVEERAAAGKVGIADLVVRQVEPDLLDAAGPADVRHVIPVRRRIGR